MEQEPIVVTQTKEEKALPSIAASRASRNPQSDKSTIQEDMMNKIAQEEKVSQVIDDSESAPKDLSKGTLDLEKLKLPQNFAANVGVKKAPTMVPVRKPNRQEFIRVRPEEEYQYSTWVLELKETREYYLIDPDLWQVLPGEIVPKVFLTTINKQGVLTLWPIRLPGEDGQLDPWNVSAMEAASLAQAQWVRVAANMSLGGYETFIATGDFAEPEWPELSMQKIMDVAFKGRYVDSEDHPVIQRLRGEI